MASRADGRIMIEGARLIFRNFAGKEGMYNREGDRNFCVLLDPELAEQLTEDGWNIKNLRAREPGDPDQPYIQVSVGFKNRPPQIWMITSHGRTHLTEAECEIFDWVDIKTVDITIRPYTWEVGGKHGIKAYLKTIFLTVDEDDLEIKYADVPELDMLPTRSGKVDEGLALPAGTARQTYDIDGEVVQ